MYVYMHMYMTARKLIPGIHPPGNSFWEFSPGILSGYSFQEFFPFLSSPPSHIFFSSPRKSWRAPTPLRIGRWTRGIIPRQSMQRPLRFQQRPGHWLRAEEAALETDIWSGKLHCMIRYNRRAKRVAYMRRVTLGIRRRNGNRY